MTKLIITIAAAVLLSTSITASAHSEHDKARFVAPTGQDTGYCDNVLRPCKSIVYAVSQANKGDKILLSAGKYDISSSEEVFLLKSNIVPIFGGYNRFDHYQSQSPQLNITKLTNVPPDMIAPMRAKGFSVIADGKSFKQNKALQQKLADYQKLSTSQANITCENGKADVFDCNNVDLLAHFPLTQMSSNPAAGSDIWGHVDLNTGREYAIMGIYDGTIVVDVTDPIAPKEVGTVTGVNSSWRDVKVYQYFDETINLWQAYAYVTTEGSSSGGTDYVSILDLNNLPNQVSLVTKSKVAGTAHNVYISNVDYTLNIALPNQTPSIQIVGAPVKSGAFVNYGLSDPIELIGANRNYGSGYTHDGSSLAIDDQRAANDCGIAAGNCTVFIDFNEKEMKLWNITDPNNSILLGSAEYNDVDKSFQYVHSGWGTENKQYVLLHDEFDEYKGGLNTTVRIFSIDNLKQPVQVGQWTGPTRAIDHNGFVRGNRYYMSNYERGLTILDISDPANPTDIGFFDTYTPSNNSSFHGAWGVYPFLPSGNIIVSDIDSGLYILKDNTKSANQGQFSFDANSYDAEQGQTLSLSIERNASELDQAVSVSYQVIQGSAKDDSDFVVENNTLTWSADDNNAKVISIEINDDPSNNEYPENFFVRLYDPQNGATLGSNHYATVNIAGIPDAGAGTFSLADATVAENSGEYTVHVNRIGSTSGELLFDYQATSNQAIVGEDVEQASGQLHWADGESQTKEILLAIIDDSDEENDESFTVTLTPVNNARLGANSQITITIADDDKNNAPTVTLNENFQVNTNQTVTLTAQASDVDNDEMHYLWQQTAGSSVTLSNADALTTSFTAPSNAGELSFEFRATDFRGATSSQIITVTVVAPVEQRASKSGGGNIHWLSLLGLLLMASARLAANKRLNK